MNTPCSNHDKQLSEEEHREREMLLRLQADSKRWFTQEEYDRLMELSKRLFYTSESPEFQNN